MIKLFLIINKHGEMKFNSFYDDEIKMNKTHLINQLYHLIIQQNEQNSFFMIERMKIIFRKYSNIYVIIGCTIEENENEIIELIHFIMKIFSKIIGNLTETLFLSRIDDFHFILDCIIFNGLIINTDEQSIINECLFINKDSLYSI